MLWVGVMGYFANRSALSDARSSNQFSVRGGGDVITLPLNEALAALPAFANGITRDQLSVYTLLV